MQKKFCDMQLVTSSHAVVNPEKATVCTAEQLFTGSMQKITVASDRHAFTLLYLKFLQRPFAKKC